MIRVALSSILFLLACGGWVVQPAMAQPNDSRLLNPPIHSTITCGELLSLLHSNRTFGGVAILWLDGYYSGRAGLTQLSQGWVQTVSQGIGGTCAIAVNASRSVLDVIAQLHREYGKALPQQSR